MYKVNIRKSAIKELAKLPSNEALKITKELRNLIKNPRPVGCKKLIGYKNLYRLRIGNYRVIYLIDDEIQVIEITKIGNRKEIYNLWMSNYLAIRHLPLV